MAVISNNTNNTLISGTNGADTITNSGLNVTINGGTGDDSIRLSGSSQVIEYASGDGNDTITNFNLQYDTLHITSGTISSVTTNGLDGVLKIGSNTITVKNVAGSSIKIMNASGNINQTVIGNVVIGTDGNDTLTNKTAGAIIRPGNGNDVVSLSGSKQLVRYSGGNDTIYGIGDNDTISGRFSFDSWRGSVSSNDAVLSYGYYSGGVFKTYGSSLTIKNAAKKKFTLTNNGEEIYAPPTGLTLTGDSTITDIINFWDNVAIKGSAVNTGLTVHNSGSKVTIDTGTGNDYISNRGATVTIDAGTGNDVVSLDAEASLSTIALGAGNDSIYNSGSNVSINGGADNDSIYSSYDSANVTINGGVGDDSIRLSGRSQVIEYASGDGNDTIERFDSQDTLHITSGTISSVTTNGIDGVIKVGSSTLTFKGAAGSSLNVMDASGNVSQVTLGNVVSGTDGNDTLTNKTAGAIIQPGNGNDVVSLAGSKQLVRHSGGNDTVYGIADNDTIIGNFDYNSWKGSVSGNDAVLYEGWYDDESGDVIVAGGTLTIKNAAKKKFTLTDGRIIYSPPMGLTLTGGNSTAEIGNLWDNVTINGSAVNTGLVFYNSGSNVSVKGGSGDDYIAAVGSTNNVSIDAGNGDNYVELTDYDWSNFVYKGGKDTDWIHLQGDVSDAAIDVGDGDNYVDIDTDLGMRSKNISVKGGAGIDQINLIAENSTVDGGDGDDYIHNYGSRSIIRGGDGNDNIDVGGGAMTINGGKGNDNIHAGGFNIIEYANGDGNDTIFSYDDPNMVNGGLIHLTSGSISSAEINDSDVVFKIGTGSITFQVYSLYSGPVLVKDSKNNLAAWYVDSATNSLKKLDTITYSSEQTFINGVSDTVLTLDRSKYERGCNYGSHVTINADGDSSINNLFNSYVVINASDSGNQIYNNGSNVTINTGDGNDFITLNGSNQVVNYSGGDDNIVGITPNDKIKISDSYSTVESGNDIIVNVGDGSITFYNAKGVALDISDPAVIEEADPSTSGITYDPKKPSTITVKNPFSGVVDAAKFSDKVTMIDASADSNPVTLKSGDKSTVLKAGDGGSVLIGGKAADKFYGGNGVDVFTCTVGSSGADNFYDVGTEDIVSISGSTLDKLTFKDSKSTVTITFDGDAKSKLSVSKVNSVDPLTLNVDGKTFVYGELPTGVKFKDDAKTAITVGAAAADGVIVNAAEIVSTAKTIDGSAASGTVHLIGNDNANVIVAGNHGSTLYGGHSKKAVADKLTGGKGKDVFVYAVGDGADQINSYNAADGDIISIVGDVTSDKLKFAQSGKNVVLTVDNQKLTINNAQYAPIVAVHGDDTLTFNSLASGLSYDAKRTALTISDPFVGTIDANDYASTLVTLNASSDTGVLTLIGNAKTKAIYGGSGETTLIGNSTKDQYYGSDGSDTFVYNGGKDQIVGFDNTKDKIKVVGTDKLTANDIAEKGSDIILTVGKGTLTIKDAPRGTLTIEQDGGKTLTYTPLASGLSYDTKKVKLTADKDFKGVIDGYASTVEEITAANSTDTVSIVGNDRNNVLRASKGGSTLDGGSGNDTLFGGAGADLFVYNGGNDYINGYSADDVIDLQKAVTGSSINKSDVILKFGDDALTIKGGLNNEIVINDANGKEASYLFTSAATYKLTALNADLTDAAGGGAQLLTEDYWFEQSAFENDPLEEVSAIKDVSLDLSAEFKDAFNRSTLELASAARHRRK